MHRCVRCNYSTFELVTIEGKEMLRCKRCKYAEENKADEVS